MPTQVEVQIITREPKIKEEEIERVKKELRDFTDRINKGETTFSTLARMYSEDPALLVVEENMALQVVGVDSGVCQCGI